MNEFDKIKNLYNLLVENSSKTFFTGGTVRDFLLNKKIFDYDIATNLSVDYIVELLKKNKIKNLKLKEKYLNFGVIKYQFENKYTIDITALRKEVYKKNSRYPKISFINSLKEDSKRRDFTVNSLYLSLKNNKLLDYHKGKKDLENKIISFIGKPEKRIKEDPLRIVRAIRFCVGLNFKLERKTYLAIKKNFNSITFINKKLFNNEIYKEKNILKRELLKNILKNKKLLDNYK